MNLANCNEEQLPSLSKQIEQSSLEGKLLVLYAGEETDRGGFSAYFNRIASDPSRKIPNCLGILPVSPSSITSTERVAKALRWFIDHATFNNYPKTLNTFDDLKKFLDTQNAAIDWIAAGSAVNELTICKPPEGYEVESFLNEFERFRKNSNFFPKKNQNQWELAEYENFKKKLFDVVKKSQEFLYCPITICGGKASVSSFEKRDRNCFKCSCSKCETTWELRSCADCGENYPVIFPGGKFPQFKEADHNYFGSDLLAHAEVDKNGELKFVCPNPECFD